MLLFYGIVYMATRGITQSRGALLVGRAVFARGCTCAELFVDRAAFLQPDEADRGQLESDKEG